MSDRDTFAAAALTGLLSNVERYQNEPLTRQAYEIADFMLRERGKTGPMQKDKQAEASGQATPQRPPSGVAEAYATAKQISDAQDFVRDRERFYAWANSRPAAAACGKTCSGNEIDVSETLNELQDLASMESVDSDIRSTCRQALEAIIRLRTWVNELQLTEEERQAVKEGADAVYDDGWDEGAKTLRKLLERTK